jgi:Mn2+/Fe2+ NRAMP family transporter
VDEERSSAAGETEADGEVPEKPPVDPGCLPAWDVDDLPAPAPFNPRNIMALIGPGMVLAGSSLGTGEWISGAAVAALYQGALLWVAPLAILCQVILNTEVMRYTLVTGEPVFTGFMRSKPGPRFWLIFYVLMDCLTWWPTLAGLTAQILLFTLFGVNERTMNPQMISATTVGVVVVCALLLCFGGKIYNTLETVLSGKVIFVLVYMTLVCVLFVPWDVWGRVSVGMVNPFWVPDNADWSRVATIVGFAGIGGMGNILASNYVREKGWGMGAKVGAIASAFGGHNISLSHIGTMCHPTEESQRRFQLWWKQIQRDQFGLWTWGSIVGMLLPCLLGAAYLKGDYFAPGKQQWQAAVALATDFGAVHGEVFTKLTLLCGFIIMFPGTFSSMDGIARRWCDAIWSGSRRARSAQAHQAKYLYYGFIGAYVVIGCIIAARQIAAPTMMKVAGNLANISIMCCCLHTLYVNSRFLPKEFKPSILKRVGLAFAAMFYFGITAMMLSQQWPKILDGSFFK